MNHTCEKAFCDRAMQTYKGMLGRMSMVTPPEVHEWLDTRRMQFSALDAPLRYAVQIFPSDGHLLSL